MRLDVRGGAGVPGGAAGGRSPAASGLAGASIGANLAVLAAADDPTVRSLALLSVGLDYRGLRLEAALKKFGARPALLVASQEDPYA